MQGTIHQTSRTSRLLGLCTLKEEGCWGFVEMPKGSAIVLCGSSRGAHECLASAGLGSRVVGVTDRP